MKTLVDTNVLSEARRAGGDKRVRERLRALDDSDVYLSVVTIGEIVHGIERLPRGRKRRELEVWVREIEDHHAERLLPIDVRVARIWGEVTARASLVGRTLPVADGLIAATALRHDLALMTRNTADFAGTSVRLIDPIGEGGG